MKIINPLYDSAFKYLMDNEQIAKMVLSIILDTKVLQLQSKPEETPINANMLIETEKIVNVTPVKMARYDFKAIIQPENGEEQTVLIELQKYNQPDPILRFRQYLASNYLKEDTFIDSNGKEQVRSLPIITIYILGFNLDGFETQAIKVLNQPFDLIKNKILDVKNDFVNLLTHPSIILQAAYKGKNYGTRLEKFLNLFHQKLRGENSDYIIELEKDEKFDGDLKEIVEYLSQALLNEKLLRQLKLEESFNKSVINLKNDLEEERRQKEEERRQKEEALAKEKEKSIKLALKMLKYGETIEEIMQETGLTREEIEKIKKKT